MSTDLYLLPPDQWPDRSTPPPPPPRRHRWAAPLLFGVVAVAAGAGVVAVGPDVYRDVRGERPASLEVAAGPVPEPVATTTTVGPVSDPADAVYLITVDACGIQGTGSGFAIDAHHVVTNAHVVQADANPQLRSPMGERYVGRVVGLHGINADGHVDPDGTPDVAVIELDIALPGYLAWATSPPSVGEKLSGMTFPDGVYTPTTGTVMASLAQGFEMRGDFDQGSSGGAVLSPTGEVEGIVTGGSEGGGRAFAFGATILKPIVDGLLAAPTPLAEDCAYAW